MIDKYVLMNGNIPVGDFIYDTNTKKFSFQKYDIIVNKGNIPLGMHSYKNWNLEYKPTHEDIVFWLSDRVVPKERQNIDEILKAMGLNDYDMWELCRRTRVMCMEDYFWLSKGEKYEDVHIRYLSEHGRLEETPIPFEAESYPPEYIISSNEKIEKNTI